MMCYKAFDHLCTYPQRYMWINVDMCKFTLNKQKNVNIYSFLYKLFTNYTHILKASKRYIINIVIYFFIMLSTCTLSLLLLRIIYKKGT